MKVVALTVELVLFVVLTQQVANNKNKNKNKPLFPGQRQPEFLREVCCARDMPLGLDLATFT
jgi:hypothetical protein